MGNSLNIPLCQDTSNCEVSKAAILMPQKRPTREAKVLILGNSDAGKSTLSRHMRQLHGKTFTDTEIVGFKEKVRSASLKHFISILHDFLKEENLQQPLQCRCERFLEEWKRGTNMERHFLDSGIEIWRILQFQKYIQWKIGYCKLLVVRSIDNPKHADSEVQSMTFEKQMHSDDPAKHFLLCFDRIMTKGYHPNIDDILNLKDPTIGMVETMFRKDDLVITLIDVGGQRSERKKWLHYFDGVDVVLFVVAMSEYDQTLLENTNVNRMQESLNVFDSVCNNRWFLKSAILLFLNKKDVFDEKLIYSPMENCFPEYAKEKEKVDPKEFIQSQFRSRNRTHSTIYCHYTNAKDTENVKVMFDVLIDKINVDAMKMFY